MILNKNNNKPYLIIDIKIIYALSNAGIWFKPENGRYFVYPNYTMNPWLKHDWIIMPNFTEIKFIIKKILGLSR